MTRRALQFVLPLIAVAAAAGGGFYLYRQWEARRIAATETAAKATEKPRASLADGSMPVRISPQARANLGLTAQPIKPTTYWRKVDVPGVIVDRPGVSDRGVIAPVTGVVTEIRSHPGETVEPSAPLFTLRLTSESLHASQRELFRASRGIEIARQQKQRLEGVVQSGAIAQARVIEIDNEVQRLDATVQAYRHELLARGLSEAQVEAAADGKFVSEIVVRAPPEQAIVQAEIALVSGGKAGSSSQPFKFEFQELEVALGQQAEAGKVLCHLADHRTLLIEGHGFKDDMPLIQEAARTRLPIEVEFEESKPGQWPPAPKELFIHHIENTIDTQTRTFGFHLVLENQWQTYKHEEHTGLLWRFRPGDRVRLRVAVEKLENVFVVPQVAVVREGPEAYVFRQNGDLFDRRPVHVLAEDRTSVVIANDGSLRPGSYIAQNSAASLNRVLKAQLASGQPSNVHVHADGTVHEAH